MDYGKIWYRLINKVKYFCTTNEFNKRKLELNRDQKVIHSNKKSFYIKGQKIEFNKNDHRFLLERFDLLETLLGVPNSSLFVLNNEIYYEIDPFKLLIKTPEDLFIINEIFIENCYNFHTIHKPITVIDIGMNVGFASLYF